MQYELSDHEWSVIRPMLPNKLRLVVTTIEVCSYRRLIRWNRSCPPDRVMGR